MSKRKTPAGEIAAFRTWLTAAGAEVLEPTNPFEVVRFRSTEGTSIMYRKANGQRTMVGQMVAAYEAFTSGRSMRFSAATPAKRQGHPVRETVAGRDGRVCFYCGDPDANTIEHLVARTHGGPDHISNKFLSCRKCNSEAGHLSAPEKIRMREQKHGFAVRRTIPIHFVLSEAA